MGKPARATEQPLPRAGSLAFTSPPLLQTPSTHMHTHSQKSYLEASTPRDHEVQPSSITRIPSTKRSLQVVSSTPNIFPSLGSPHPTLLPKESSPPCTWYHGKAQPRSQFKPGSTIQAHHHLSKPHFPTTPTHVRMKADNVCTTPAPGGSFINNRVYMWKLHLSKPQAWSFRQSTKHGVTSILSKPDGSHG